jgi:dTDP-4-amino-4,6-dideoxygalactose transaminase
VGPGDEVITVSHTFIATAEAISLTGARPVFVDVDEATMLLDPDAAAAAITPRTKAIVPVHLYGQPVNMDRLGEVARRHRLVIVEDAAQAHGARWQGRRVGTLGDVACFSFYPGKNLGAYGDAGAVVTNQGALGQRVRMLANHGRTEKYLHEMEGVNSRLDTVQAAILDVKLRHLDAWNEARRQVAARYLEALQGSDMRLPQVQAAAEPVWHLFVVRVPRRDRLLSRLKEHGIAAGIHYPIPLHLQPAYRHLGIKEGALPITERVAQEIISLPIYPELPLEAVERIAGTVRQLLRD